MLFRSLLLANTSKRTIILVVPPFFRKNILSLSLTIKSVVLVTKDQEIKKLVEDQKAVGIKGITDGEFRRGFWHLDFLEELNGIEGYVPETGYNQTFHGKAAPAYNIRVVDKLSFNPNHPFLKDFAFLKEVVETDDTFVAKAKSFKNEIGRAHV